jgi:hypothetical protein
MTENGQSISKRMRCVRSRFMENIPRKLSEEGKNDVLHFSNWQLLHPQGTGSPWEGEKYKLGGSKSHRGKNVKSGGSDPTFSAFSRPKSSWGRSRPAAR